MAGKQRITKTVVDKLGPGEIVWDTLVRGFGVRRQKSDARVYFVKAREGGRQRWYTIGRAGAPWTPDKARERSISILGAIADNENPAAIRDETKRNPTVSAYADLFLQHHVDAKRKPKTANGYRDLLNRLIVPKIGSIRVADVAYADVAQLHRDLRRTPYQANRAVAVLSKMLSLAERDGLRPLNSNPCRHIEKYKERKRERFLSELELATLGETLTELERDGLESPYVIGAVRLLIFTGARLGEVLGLQWAHVDFENAILRLPDSKTGQKVIYLSAPALETLSGLPSLQNNPHVIAGHIEGAALVDLEKPWRRIRTAATVRLWAKSEDDRITTLVDDLGRGRNGVPTYAECEAVATNQGIVLPVGLADVRLHDLRHSFAAVAASGGLSLPIIGKLLGHTQAQTTNRYSHLAADPVRAANEAVGQKLATSLRAKKPKTPEVVQLKRV